MFFSARTGNNRAGLLFEMISLIIFLSGGFGPFSLLMSFFFARIANNRAGPGRAAGLPIEMESSIKGFSFSYVGGNVESIPNSCQPGRI